MKGKIMTTLLFTLLFGCTSANKSTSVATATPPVDTDQQTETATASTAETPDVKPLVTTSTPTGIVYLIDSDGNRTEASKASPGEYNAVLTITLKDSKGVREEDVPIGNVELTVDETTHIECKSTLNEEQNELTLGCSINGQ